MTHRTRFDCPEALSCTTWLNLAFGGKSCVAIHEALCLVVPLLSTLLFYCQSIKVDTAPNSKTITRTSNYLDSLQEGIQRSMHRSW